MQCEALDTISMLIPETALELHVQSCAELFTGNSLLLEEEEEEQEPASASQQDRSLVPMMAMIHLDSL